MKRTAFTLIELLTVMVIIGVLAALLIPAVNHSREAARRSQCMTRQRDIVLAMTAYNTDYGCLPGVLNPMPYLPPPPAPPVFSWVAAILPMLGENTRYEKLLTNPADSEATGTLLEAVICPTARKSGNLSPLHYVVNCGPVQEAGMGSQTTGFVLFPDRRSSNNKKVKLEEIPDGMGNTILLSENIDAQAWAFAPSGMLLNELGGTRSSVVVGNCGFLWDSCVLSATPPAIHAPYPRPSSYHAGVYIVCFGSSSAKTLNDDTPLDIYLKAVCPDDEKAKKSIADGGLR